MVVIHTFKGLAPSVSSRPHLPVVSTVPNYCSITKAKMAVSPPFKWHHLNSIFDNAIQFLN